MVAVESLYAPRDAKAKGQTAIRNLMYRNGLQCAISVAEYLPTHSSTYLLSLISFIEKSGSITGLESIFLTFLNAVSANGDIKTFQQAIIRVGTNPALNMLSSPMQVFLFSTMSATRRWRFLTKRLLTR